MHARSVWAQGSFCLSPLPVGVTPRGPWLLARKFMLPEAVAAPFDVVSFPAAAFPFPSALVERVLHSW